MDEDNGPIPIEKEKKKRGRKPGKKKAIEIKIPKKRGRKPKVKDYSVQSNVNTMNTDNIILHLPIQRNNNTGVDSKELELLTYKPEVSIPLPNETDGLNHYFNNVEFLGEDNVFPYNKNEIISNNTLNTITNIDTSINTEVTSTFNTEVNSTVNTEVNTEVNNHELSENDLGENGIIINVEHSEDWYKNNNNDTEINSYQEMIESIKKKRASEIETDNLDQNTIRSEFFLNHFSKGWPQSSSVYCWWCSHPFKGCPCAIPKDFINNKFITYGIFCSPECAASYNFDEGNNEWEQYSLLNLLYKNLYKEPNLKIKLAVDRKLLKIFGGSLNIMEFRKLNYNYEKTFKVINPPMISIVPIQELNFIDTGYSSKSYSTDVSIKKQNIDETSVLKLKRSKPIYSNNTLENLMNINISN